MASSSKFVPHLANIMRNATVRLFLENDARSWTGSIIGGKDGKSIILTVSHPLITFQDLEDVEKQLRVQFYMDDQSYRCKIGLYLRDSDIMLLIVDKRTLDHYKLKFSPENDWDLMDLQTLCAVAHPLGHLWRIDRREVCCSHVKNNSNPKVLNHLDEELIYFEHRLDLPIGASGAALVNESGYMVGMQVAAVNNTTYVISPSPLDAALKEREEKVEALYIPRIEKAMDVASRDMEINNLATELGKISTHLAQFRRSDIVPVHIPASNIKIATHIKYIYGALRKDNLKVGVGELRFQSLQKDLEDRFIRSSATSSSRMMF